VTDLGEDLVAVATDAMGAAEIAGDVFDDLVAAALETGAEQ